MKQGWLSNLLNVAAMAGGAFVAIRYPKYAPVVVPALQAFNAWLPSPQAPATETIVKAINQDKLPAEGLQEVHAAVVKQATVTEKKVGDIAK